MTERKKHKQAIAEYFSRNTQTWKNIYDDDEERRTRDCRFPVQKRMKMVLQLFKRFAEKRKLKVLDAGCGTGIITKTIAERGHDVIGIDLSIDMVKETKKNLRENACEADCLQADIEDLPFRSSSFDLVLGLGVLPWLQTDHESIREMNRVVKHDGIIILILPNLLRISNFLDPYYIYRGIHYVWYQAYGKRIDDLDAARSQDIDSNKTFRSRRYRYGQLNSLFKKYNLENVATLGVEYDALTLLGKSMVTPYQAQKISNTLFELAQKKGFVWMKAFASQWIICLRKKE